MYVVLNIVVQGDIFDPIPVCAVVDLDECGPRLATWAKAAGELIQHGGLTNVYVTDGSPQYYDGCEEDLLSDLKQYGFKIIEEPIQLENGVKAAILLVDDGCVCIDKSGLCWYGTLGRYGVKTGVMPMSALASFLKLEVE